jgi:hypothetical protein
MPPKGGPSRLRERREPGNGRLRGFPPWLPPRPVGGTGRAGARSRRADGVRAARDGRRHREPARAVRQLDLQRAARARGRRLPGARRRGAARARGLAAHGSRHRRLDGRRPPLHVLPLGPRRPAVPVDRRRVLPRVLPRELRGAAAAAPFAPRRPHAHALARRRDGLPGRGRRQRRRPADDRQGRDGWEPGGDRHEPCLSARRRRAPGARGRRLRADGLAARHRVDAHRRRDHRRHDRGRRLSRPGGLGHVRRRRRLRRVLARGDAAPGARRLGARRRSDTADVARGAPNAGHARRVRPDRRRGAGVRPLRPDEPVRALPLGRDDPRRRGPPRSHVLGEAAPDRAPARPGDD